MATDSAGTNIWAATYTPFGGIRSVDVNTGALSTQELRFPGQWFQAETGLHQNWHRDYDPTLGRYLQADPLGLVDGPSVYGYALQSPVRYTDPTGEFAWPVVRCGLSGPCRKAVKGAIVGACVASGVCPTSKPEPPAEPDECDEKCQELRDLVRSLKGRTGCRGDDHISVLTSKADHFYRLCKARKDRDRICKTPPPWPHTPESEKVAQISDCGAYTKCMRFIKLNDQGKL